MSELGVAAGQVIAGKFRLVSLLGTGGMASVWRVEHLTLDAQVALKLLKPAIAERASSRQRFLREAKAAARLRSPHVVQILEYGSEGELAFIAMELLEGESLAQRLRRKPPLSQEVVARIMTHIGRALARAHSAGIVHRDLKPDNVFLVDDDGEIIAKVLDFGIAKSVSGSFDEEGGPQTKTGTMLGTPYYMSPEQLISSKDVDHRCDLWALGVIVHECICGVRPFRGETIGDLVLQISGSTRRVWHGMARPAPIQRRSSLNPSDLRAKSARTTGARHHLTQTVAHSDSCTPAMGPVTWSNRRRPCC